MAAECPICFGGAIREVVKWTSRFVICKCCDCRVIFTAPLPSPKEISDFYQGFLYRKPDKPRQKRLIEKKKKELAVLFGLEGGDYTGRKFLDMGGGTGIAYAAACRLGLDVYYQEVDEAAIEFVQNRFGIDKGHLFRSPEEFCDVHFDYIFSDNVLEHSPNPLEFVRRLYAQLEPGGVLLLKTPHAANTEIYFYPAIALRGYFLETARHNGFWRAARTFFLDRCWTCDPPRHLYAFSKQSLEKIARSIGIAGGEYSVECYHIPLWEYSLSVRICRWVANGEKLWSLILLPPAAMIEGLSKVVQLVCMKLRLVSPGGIMLRIRKGPQTSDSRTRR